MYEFFLKGGGSALMRRHGCLEHMVRGMTKVLSKPLTLKMRTAVYHDTRVAHALIKKAKLWDVSMITVSLITVYLFAFIFQFYSRLAHENSSPNTTVTSHKACPPLFLLCFITHPFTLSIHLVINTMCMMYHIEWLKGIDTYVDRWSNAAYCF